MMLVKSCFKNLLDISNRIFYTVSLLFPGFLVMILVTSAIALLILIYITPCKCSLALILECDVLLRPRIPFTGLMLKPRITFTLPTAV